MSATVMLANVNQLYRGVLQEGLVLHVRDLVEDLSNIITVCVFVCRAISES